MPLFAATSVPPPQAGVNFFVWGVTISSHTGFTEVKIFIKYPILCMFFLLEFFLSVKLFPIPVGQLH